MSLQRGGSCLDGLTHKQSILESAAHMSIKQMHQAWFCVTRMGVEGVCWLLQGVIAVQAAAVLGCLVQCSRARSAVWAAGGGSTLLPALLGASPLALSGEQPM